MSRADDLIERLQVRIVELEAVVAHRDRSISGMNEAHWLVVQELAALKAQPSGVVGTPASMKSPASPPRRAQPVPDGYALVPINLTESMYAKCHLHNRVAAQVWRDLLAAAPSAKKGCTKPGCFPYCDCGGIDDAPPAQQKESGQ